MMRTYYYILSLCCCLFLVACGDDDNIGPLQGERNWLVLEDSDDPIDGLRYDIFTEYGIPIYYNDTIGSETRYSTSGEPYTYYERLQVFYNPGGSTVIGRFTLLEDKNDTKPVMDYLVSDIFPLIPESFYIPSIFLVDSLVVNGDSVAYKGFNTVICGKVKEFETMNETNRSWWRGGVMRALVINGLMNNESEWLEENFYSLTIAVNPDRSDRMYSSASSRYYLYSVMGNIITEADKQTLGACGFLNYKFTGTSERMAYMPTREEDVSLFCEAIFALTQEEFTARWGEYPVVMEKYAVMKAKLEEYGFETN